MSTGVEDEFHQRWTALGLAETAVGLPVDATITGRTLPLAAWAAGGPQLQSASKLASAELPRISVELGGSAPAPDPAQPPGTRADLLLLSTLGEGGMGRVHLARQRSLGREVAVKALKEQADGTAAEALLHEARLAGSLEHPGVIPVHALGLDDDGRPLLVMKRVDGVEWRQLLCEPDHPLLVKRGATDALTASLEIMLQLCQTLEFAHSRGVVHLDIKPENVMIGEFGEVYLLDWGIARALGPGAERPRGIVGTPAYMAPEMVLGHPVDHRTDLYLLGAVLHEVLTGRHRHDGKTLQSVLLAAALSSPVEYAEGIPEALASLANRATSRDAAERPESAEAFRRELAEFLRQKSANALADTARGRLEELEAQLGHAPEGQPPSDLGLAHQLATEARFGFAQALRESSTHAGAREGARRVRQALIELELRQEHADTARALLAELADPPADLVSRIEAAERRAERRHHERERLRAMDRDLDPSVSAGARSGALGVAAVLVLGVSGYIVLVQGLTNVTPARLLNISVFLNVTIIGSLLFARRALMTNAFNRRLALLLSAAAAGSLLNRAIGFFAGTAVETTVVADLALFVGVAAGGAVAVLPSLWWPVAVFVFAIAGVRMLPGLALPIFSTSTLVNLLLVAFLLWREARKRRAAA